MSSRSYGNRPNRCPARRQGAGYQCQLDGGHRGEHTNFIVMASWRDEPEPARVRPVAVPDLVQTLEAFVRAVIAETRDDSRIEDVVNVTRARQDLITALVEREGA